MQSALRPYATTGVAIAGAGLIAVTPALVPLPDTPAAPTARDVALTAGGGFFEPFIEPFNTASDNFAQILQNFGLAPFVGLQQAIVNQAGFLQDVFDDPSNITDVVDQTQENLKTVLTSLIGFGADQDTFQDVVLNHTLLDEGVPVVGLSGLFGLIPGFLPSDLDPDVVQPILNFIASPMSGVLIGSLGPIISPVVALMDGIDAGDSPSELLAGAFDAFLNGTDVNLDSLIPTIADAGILPEDFDIDHLGIALGGLFSTGDVEAGPFGVATEFTPDEGNDDVDVISVPAVGGSILNSIDLQVSGVPVVNDLDITGDPVGPLAALVGMSETVGVLLGSGWDEGGGKSGDYTGPAIPPLLHLLAPNLPDDFFDGGDGDSGAAEAVSDMLSGGDTLADTWGNFF